MSRRRYGREFFERHRLDGGVHRDYYIVELYCPSCEAHGRRQLLGSVLRPLGRVGVSAGLRDVLVGLEWVGGPPDQGSKVRATCSTCRNEDRRTAVEMSWPRIQQVIQEMESSAEHLRHVVTG
jgi:hypothetical protein